MITLSDVVQPPSQSVLAVQPQVVAYVEERSIEEGTLTIAESVVTWVGRDGRRGFSFPYPSVVLHAIWTDLSSFPHEHLYVLVDAARADRQRRSRRNPRRQIRFFADSNEQAQHQAEAEELQLEPRAGDQEDESLEDDEDERQVVVRFVPADTGCLQHLYQQMCRGQELNPEEEEDPSGDDEDFVDDEGGAEHQLGEHGISADGNFYTAEDVASDNFELSAEGRANLERILANSRQPQPNGHHDGGGGGGDEDNNGMEQ